MNPKSIPTPPPRVVFMGSPEFAVPSLRGLTQAGYEICLVVSQPDRPAGRGRHVRRPAVAQMADSLGITVYQPSTLRTPDSREAIVAQKPDLVVVAAFGLLLPQAILELPAHGCINVHASLLPRHRGAAPIQAAIIAGDEETGVTIMEMDAGMDTGGIVSQRSLVIGPTDTAAELDTRLAELGRDLLLDTLPGWIQGNLQAYPQDASLATYAPRIQRQDARIDWSRSAIECARRVRAYRGWPNAYTSWGERNVIVLECQPAGPEISGTPGSVLVERGAAWSPAVITGDGLLHLQTVQLEGKRPVSGAQLLDGYPALNGAILG